VPPARSQLAHELTDEPDRAQPALVAPAPLQLAPVSPAAVIALQRSAGNAKVANLLRQPVEPSRIPPELTLKTPRNPYQSYPGDDPLAPVVEFPKPLEPAEKEFLAEMRGKTRFRANMCFTKYADAAQEIKQEYAKKQSSPGFLEQLIELAVGSLAPGLVAFALAPLRNELKSIASLAIEKVVKDGDKAVSTYMSAEKLVDKYLDDKDRAGDAVKGLKAAWGATNVRPDQPVGPMLDGIVQEFSEYLDGISEKLATMSPAEQVGAYAAFDPKKATKHYYKRLIEDLVKDSKMLTGAAEPGTGSLHLDREIIVEVEAYGVRELAIVSEHVGGAAYGNWYDFKRWVPPESRETAKTLGHGQETGLQLTAGAEWYQRGRHSRFIKGLPAPWEGEQYVEMVVKGKPRLAKMQMDIHKPKKFIEWVAPEDELYARGKGERQYGFGLRRFDEREFPVPPPPPRREDREAQ
jgi:hypothetical protein